MAIPLTSLQIITELSLCVLYLSHLVVDDVPTAAFSFTSRVHF